LLSLTNKIILHHNWMISGKWRLGDKEAASVPLRRRKIGLMGYGAVNQKVHSFLKGFDLSFAALKRDWEIEPDGLECFTMKQLHDFLNCIDTMVVAIPHTSQTEDLIKLKELKLLGKRGLIVQLGRGIIINERDLFLALDQGIITGAAIDVWYNYKPEEDENGGKYPFSFPFHKLDNVILSPHRAASPFNDMERWDEVVENIKRISVKRKDLINIVNLEREY